MSESLQVMFEADELAIVLSHYDIGVLESVTPLQRGSRQSPKVGIVAQRGKFLLKRRAACQCHPDRIRFAHEVQAHLQRARFPAPVVYPTRSAGRTFVDWRGSIYELFEFIPGHRYRHSSEESHGAGQRLAQFHRITSTLRTTSSIPTHTYHDNPQVSHGLEEVRQRYQSSPELTDVLARLRTFYRRAGEAASENGLSTFPAAVIHADWHPGNMLFRKNKVVAVIDYDSVRVARRIVDVANGALQFSMIGGAELADWPDGLDEKRFTAFLAGYESLAPLQPGEAACLAPLMVEALIAECVSPIARTDRFGHYTPQEFLPVALRKVEWLEERRQDLLEGRTVPSTGASE